MKQLEAVKAAEYIDILVEAGSKPSELISAVLMIYDDGYRAGYRDAGCRSESTHEKPMKEENELDSRPHRTPPASVTHIHQHFGSNGDADHGSIVSKAQSINLRTKLEFRGKIATIKEWARDPRVTIGASTIKKRLREGRFSVERALFNPEKVGPHWDVKTIRSIYLDYKEDGISFTRLLKRYPHVPKHSIHTLCIKNGFKHVVGDLDKE